MLVTVAGVALLVAVVLAILLATLWSMQERILFQPPGGPFPDGAGATRVVYAAADGQPLHGFLVERGVPAAGMLLVFHGNADLAVWQIEWAGEVARRTGVRVLLAEFRGYGGVPGRPTYATSRLDARAAYDAARTHLGATPESLAIFGHSLGSAVAAELASDVHPPALILQSPFTSARDMATIISRLAGASWPAISRIHFDTEARVRELDTPVWAAHGTRDLIIPVRMGRRVFEAARVKGDLLIVEGAGHNDVPETGGERYWRWMAAALAPVSPP